MPLGRQRQQPPEHPGIPDPAALDQSIEIQPVAHDLLEDLQVEGGVVGDQDTVPVGLEEGGDGVARRKNPRRSSQAVARTSGGTICGFSSSISRVSVSTANRPSKTRPWWGVHSSNGQ